MHILKIHLQSNKSKFRQKKEAKHNLSLIIYVSTHPLGQPAYL